MVHIVAGNTIYIFIAGKKSQRWQNKEKKDIFSKISFKCKFTSLLTCNQFIHAQNAVPNLT